MDEASSIASKSAEYGSQVYNSTKEKLNDFVNNGGMEDVQTQAYSKAADIGNSFWSFVCNATLNEQEKLDREHEEQPTVSHPSQDPPVPQEEKPLWGFTWGK